MEHQSRGSDYRRLCTWLCHTWDEQRLKSKRDFRPFIFRKGAVVSSRAVVLECQFTEHSGRHSGDYGSEAEAPRTKHNALAWAGWLASTNNCSLHPTGAPLILHATAEQNGCLSECNLFCRVSTRGRHPHICSPFLDCILRSLICHSYQEELWSTSSSDCTGYPYLQLHRVSPRLTISVLKHVYIYAALFKESCFRDIFFSIIPHLLASV